MPILEIDPNESCLTLIDVIDVDQSRTSEVMALLREISDEVMADRPGFLGAALHPSLDGRKIVSYVKWQSREAWESAIKRQEARSRFARVASLVKAIEPNLYRVETIHRARPEHREE